MAHIIARCPGKVAVYAAGSDTPITSYEAATSFVSSKDGSKLFVVTPSSVDIYSAQEPGKKLDSIPEAGVVLIAESPAGGYLVTATKAQKTADGEVAKNLKAWSVASGQQVLAAGLKSVSKDTWPALQWSHNDDTAILAVTNTLLVYSAADNFTAYKKCAVPGVAHVSVCPSDQYGRLAAVFMPEVKGSPAAAAIVDYTQPNPQARARKAFFRTQGAKFMWNSTGTAVLVLSYADFDATNQSYYGEQKLHYLPADPAKVDQATTVPLPKDGPVHDVQWSPAGDYFVTVAGFMPAKATLWDAACKPIFDFGSGPYNLVSWNPFGRFLALAGFGNLPGDILFFDKKTSGTCRQMGATRSPAVSAEWSPDGRHLMVATTAPRLRVDNNLKVLTYYGEQTSVVPFETLFDAQWMHSAPGTFTDRPQSPERLAASAATGSKGPTPAAAAPSRPAGYVPPHMRGAGGAGPVGGAPKPSFSLGFDANDKGGRIASAKPGAPATAAAASKPVRQVPGFEFVDVKAASKNAKRRANKKKDGEGGGSGGADDAPSSINGDTAAAGVAALSVGEEGGEGANDPGKKLRALQKKLRQVRELKDKAAKEGEKALQPEQLAKIAGEAALIAEIEALGGTA